MRMCQKHIGAHLKSSQKQNLGPFDIKKNNDSNELQHIEWKKNV